MIRPFVFAAAAFTVLALSAAPAAASEPTQSDTAQQALDAARAALQTRVRIQQIGAAEPGHGPSEQLAAVAAARDDLDEGGQLEADALLARPTDAVPTSGRGVRYDGPTSTVDTPNFRIHYAASGQHEATAAFARLMADVMESTRRKQVDDLGWRPPPSDGRRGGDGRTDVYLADLARMGFLGYAATDPGQSCANAACSDFHGYIVIDRAFSGWQRPEEILRVVVAHEYNHLLQFGYTTLGEAWWMEATAEWMAVHTEPRIDHTSSRMAHWARVSHVPLTDAGVQSGGQMKSYGSYVWNAWLAQRHGPAAVHRPWQHASRTAPVSVEAYDQSLGEDGQRFGQEFVAFAAATAEWHASGISRAKDFPDMHRKDRLETSQSVTLDHTAYALYDVPARGTTTITLTAPTPVTGGVGLVIRRPAGVHITTALLEQGAATLTADTSGAERVTVAAVNADITWASDGQVWEHERRRYSADETVFTVTSTTDSRAPSTTAHDQSGADRLDGGGAQDPVGQAVATSGALFDDGEAARVVLATADRFPDALAGAALAGSRGPILFTRGLGGLDPRTRAEILRVTGGQGQVLVLGGTAAVSEQAAAEGRTAAGDVTCSAPLPPTCRFAGSGREHTAALIAETVLAENPGQQRVLVARSDEFADAITGGAYAAATGTPVLLTPTNSLDPHMAGLMKRAGVGQAVVLGGSAAISDQVLAALPAAQRTRVAGPDRVATAAQIAQHLWQRDGRGRGGALLVNVRHADGWQSALTAAVVSAVFDAPQLGVDSPAQALPAATDAALQSLAVARVQAVGNAALVSDSQLAAALALIRTHG